MDLDQALGINPLRLLQWRPDRYRLVAQSNGWDLELLDETALRPDCTAVPWVDGMSTIEGFLKARKRLASGNCTLRIHNDRDGSYRVSRDAFLPACPPSAVHGTYREALADFLARLEAL